MQHLQSPALIVQKVVLTHVVQLAHGTAELDLLLGIIVEVVKHGPPIGSLKHGLSSHDASRQPQPCPLSMIMQVQHLNTISPSQQALAEAWYGWSFRGTGHQHCAIPHGKSTYQQNNVDTRLCHYYLVWSIAWEAALRSFMTDRDGIIPGSVRSWDAHAASLQSGDCCSSEAAVRCSWAAGSF